MTLNFHEIMRHVDLDDTAFQRRHAALKLVPGVEDPHPRRAGNLQTATMQGGRSAGRRPTANTLPVVGRRPVDGSIEWCRRWFDRRMKRGALVEVNGLAAHILSASSGFLFVRVWKTGERIRVRPYEVAFPDA